MLERSENPKVFAADPRVRIQAALFDAIEMLYEKPHFISCIKLLVSAIDTFAAVCSKDGKTNQWRFKDWLSEYLDAEGLDVTVQEIWQVRCTLIHQTSSVGGLQKAGERTEVVVPVRPLLFYNPPAHPSQVEFPATEWHEMPKFVNVVDFYKHIQEAKDRFIQKLQDDSDLLRKFNQNWEKVISDAYAYDVRKVGDSGRE